MSDYTKLSKSPKSALLYYYITNGLEFILSVAVYVIFYFIWLRLTGAAIAIVVVHKNAAIIIYCFFFILTSFSIQLI